MSGLINNAINKILHNKCDHDKVDGFSSNKHCPDCGNHIVISWFIIKCSKCKTPRMPKVNKNNQITPSEQYCTVCGSDKWYLSRTNNLKFTEFKYGIMKKDIVTEENASGNSRTDVWVEGEPLEIKRSSNVIKANRRF
jgi:hypothetical protein